MKTSHWLGLATAILVTLGLIVGYEYARAPEATLVKAGDLAPDMRLPFAGGDGTLAISRYRGRVLLIAMFMSGCKHCERDAPKLERLHRAYFKRGLVVIGISVDRDRAALEDFIQRHELTFYIAEDFGGKTVKDVYGSWRMPEAYLIDAEGRVDSVYLGGVDWVSPRIRTRVEELLERSGFEPKIP